MRVTHKDSKIAMVKQAVEGLNGSKGKVGWFESSKYEDGTPVAYIATIDEFGCPERKIPPRPFFRSTVSDKEKEWAATAAQISKAVLEGKLAPNAVTEAVALSAEGHVRKTITELRSPELSMTTIELRRRRRAGDKISGKTVGEAAKAASSAFFVAPTASESKPLVDSGYMLATLTSEFEGPEK